MSKNGRKGAAAGVLAFLSLLAALNVFNAFLRLTLQGSNSITEFSLLGIVLAYMNTEVYFWVSLILAFVFFGVTAFVIYRGFPADPELLKRLEKLEAHLALNRDMLENTQMGFFRRLEENERITDDTMHKLSLSLEEVTKKTQDIFEKQRKTLQTFEKQTKENFAAVKKYNTKLNFLSKKVEMIEKELRPPKPKLTSQSNTKSLKGVKPHLAEELWKIGITNIGEFLTIDPAVIAQKSGIPIETLTKLQAMAQLMMVPGIDKKDAELLVKVGIMSRRELANQEPVQLCKAMVGIAKAQAEHGKMPTRRIPTIEDVSSWIRFAKP